MAYNETLATRLRSALSGTEGLSEKKMFGGLAFLLNGNMCVGVLKDELVVRLGPELGPQTLGLPHTRPMDFTGKVMKTMVIVSPAGFASDDDLNQWVRMGVDFAGSLPPK